jgi:membrane protein DedA with SNARE-associated domain
VTALGDLLHLLGRYGYLMLESAGMRVFGTLVAGISRMRWSTFALYNALGGTVRTTTAATRRSGDPRTS